MATSNNTKKKSKSPTPEDIRLGARIDRVCELMGGKAVVARVLGVSEVQVYRYVKAENTPNVHLVVALANAAGVSLSWLAAGTESEYAHKALGSEDLAATVITPSEPAATAPLDRQLLGYILGELEVMRDSLGSSISSQEWAQMAVDIYGDVLETAESATARRKVAETIVANVLRLHSNRLGE